jgi:hypothetical protein
MKAILIPTKFNHQVRIIFRNGEQEVTNFDADFFSRFRAKRFAKDWSKDKDVSAISISKIWRVK